jgi:hypothetical protein
MNSHLCYEYCLSELNSTGNPNEDVTSDLHTEVSTTSRDGLLSVDRERTTLDMVIENIERVLASVPLAV